MSEFLLTREPWLPVVTPEGTDTLGLIEVFERAEDLMVAPGGPLEYRVIHRLLLAISYAALGAPSLDEYPRTLAGNQVAQWLRENEHSFDLLSPTAPFAQDAALVEEEGHAHVVSVANLDSTVARSRPLLTDHRRADDVPPMPLATTIIALLVYNAFDAPGIHEGVKVPWGTKNFSMKGTEGSTLTFIPKGTLASVMPWAMIPVENLGTPRWSYSGPGAIEVTPEGDLDALTWLSRRFLLRHDGTHATGVQIHQGWTKKTPAKNAPADSLPGQRDHVQSANDPKTSAATGEIGTYTSPGQGNPLALIERWEAGSGTSLSGHVRAALAANPDLVPPRIVIIGQRLENTALKVLTREAEVPRIRGGYAEKATGVREARQRKQLFPSDDFRALALLDIENPAEIDTALENLRVTAPNDEIDWPTNAQRLSGPAPTDALAVNQEGPETLPEGLQRALAAVLEIESRNDRDTGGAGTLRRIRYALRENPEATAHLAQAVASRTPSPQDIEPLGVPGLEKHQRLWAGLLAVAIHDWRRALDGEKPLASALRQAGARLDFARARDSLLAATASPDLEALRVPLLEALALTARSFTYISWWSLADDLERWSPQIRRAWEKAFNTKAPRPDTATPNEEEK